MTNEKMTVHKALAELKTLDKRIEKEIDNSPFVVANKHSNTKLGGIPVSEFREQMKASYQRVTTLIRRREAIKRAVVLSNASTEVAVAGEKYTVAEAIEMHNHGMDFWKRLLFKLERDYRTAKLQADDNNGEALETRTDGYISSVFDNVDMKAASAEIKKMREDFMIAQTFELVDPIDIAAEMNKLNEKINAFVADVDAALSVSNATTEIEVSY